VESGDPAGQPVVLIHGGAGGVWTWNETVKYLQNYHCIMPELPEHGGSQANGKFSIVETAKEIIAGIRREIPEGAAHIVGLSVGGQIGLEILAQAPEVVMTAIISGALVIPVPGYRLGIFSATMMKLIYKIGIHPWKNNDVWIRLNMKSSAGMPDSSFAQFKHNFQSLTLSGWTNAMSEYYRYRTPAGLELANVPVLLVAGAHELVEAIPTNRVLRRILPNNRSVILGKNQKWSAASEHNWPVTQPQLCAQTIDAWVTQTPLPAELSDDAQ
ncbi:alpha/beta hydrolase, partial [bacterium]|nr:alpha/beta hydrolase [bacterium]